MFILVEHWSDQCQQYCLQPIPHQPRKKPPHRSNISRTAVKLGNIQASFQSYRKYKLLSPSLLLLPQLFHPSHHMLPQKRLPPNHLADYSRIQPSNRYHLQKAQVAAAAAIFAASPTVTVSRSLSFPSSANCKFHVDTGYCGAGHIS